MLPRGLKRDSRQPIRDPLALCLTRPVGGTLELSSTQKTVVGSAAVLQAGVTAAAAITGGLPALFLNKEKLAVFALGAVIFAGFLTAVIAALGDLEPKPSQPQSNEQNEVKTPSPPVKRDAVWWVRFGLTILAIVSFTFGLAVTAYASVRVPGSESEPEVSASLTDGNPLVLKATVKASGVAKGENLNIYVDGLRETGPGG